MGSALDKTLITCKCFHVSNTATAQAEMFPDLPTIKMPKRVRSKWEDLNELCDLVEKHGPLIPLEMAAGLLDVSRQRVYQLVDAAKLETIEFREKRFVSEKCIRAFVEIERKNGRPPKLEVKDVWRGARTLAKGLK